MMAVPLLRKKSFIRSGDVGVNYTFEEVITGQHYILMYGVTTRDTSAVDHMLTSTEVNGYSTSVENATSFDFDFDSPPLLLPMTLEGEGIIDCAFGEGGGGSGANTNIYVVFKLRKWDGASETEIANVTTYTSTGGSDRQETTTLRFTIPRTSFAIGDVIRLTTEGYGGGGATRTAKLWIDMATAGDELKFYMPVMAQE